MKRRARGVALSRGERTSTHARRRVSASPWPAIAPRRATLGSSCASCRAKCRREPRGRAEPPSAGQRAARDDFQLRLRHVTHGPVVSNSRVLAHTIDTPRAMSSATKPRRSLNGGTSPSDGRGRSPPREREMVQRNHRRGARTPSYAFGSAPSVGTVVFAIFPPKPMRGSAPPLTPFPSTSPLTRRPHRRRPFVRIRRRSHRGRRQRPGRRRPQGGAALPSHLARRGARGRASVLRRRGQGLRPEGQPDRRGHQGAGARRRRHR